MEEKKSEVYFTALASEVQKSHVYEEDDEYEEEPLTITHHKVIIEEEDHSPSSTQVEPYRLLPLGHFYMEKAIFLVSRNPFFE